MYYHVKKLCSIKIITKDQPGNFVLLQTNWDIESLHRCDLPMLPIQIKRILCRDDCAMVPLTEKQMGFFREVDSLEDFWEVEHDPASPSPQVSPEVLVCTTEDSESNNDLRVSPQIVTPDSTRTAALEPPVKKAKQQEKTLEAILTNLTNTVKRLLTNLTNTVKNLLTTSKFEVILCRVLFKVASENVFER